MIHSEQFNNLLRMLDSGNEDDIDLAWALYEGLGTILSFEQALQFCNQYYHVKTKEYECRRF